MQLTNSQLADSPTHSSRLSTLMKNTYQDVVGEKCIRNDEGSLAGTEEEEKLAWKSHYEEIAKH